MKIGGVTLKGLAVVAMLVFVLGILVGKCSGFRW